MQAVSEDVASENGAASTEESDVGHGYLAMGANRRFTTNRDLGAIIATRRSIVKSPPNQQGVRRRQSPALR